MKNITIFNSLFILFVVLFVSCSNDDEMISMPQNEGDISEESLEWLSAFPVADNQTILYRNSDDETTTLLVSDAYNPNSSTYVDCQINGQDGQCQYENVALDFPEGTAQGSNSVVVSLTIIGEDDIRIMPSRGGITVAAARFEGSSEQIYSEQAENFTVSYQSNYLYNNEAKPAITVLTNSTENLATGGILPPKRLILVKGIGIVEWDDYSDNTWFLED